MKEYPVIERIIQKNLPIYAFDKLDGSNIRAEWAKKKGLHKFGTRSRLLGQDEKPLGEAITLLQDGWNQVIDTAMQTIFGRKHMPQNLTLYFEFYGENSFAGNHEEEDHKITLIDINIYKHGFVDPKVLLHPVWGDRSAACVYHGNANASLIESVRKNALEGMTFEGIVCKAGSEHKRIMFKIKSYAWVQKLKDFCKGNEKLFLELA
jgi:hypothetical protein